MRRNNKFFAWIFAIAVVVVFVVLMTSGEFLTKHIEDTNGESNLELVTITDTDLIEQTASSFGSIKVKEKTFSDDIKFKSGKFSGVRTIAFSNFVGTADSDISVSNFTVTQGNCELVLVKDGEIVYTFASNTNETQSYNINSAGDYAIVVGGESAEFEFTMSKMELSGFVISE